MRLLKCDPDGNISLTDDLIDNIPAYAILSHTWGAEKDEVTFDDLDKRRSPSKIKGYTKLQFCREQIQHDGLQYFWIDTCCINKANNTELSEAIISMFDWYRRAAKCYVYLSDVETDSGDDNHDQRTWETSFRNSRWFTRGWTLQELLAPISVAFFSHEGRWLGSKETLKSLIHEVTGIPVTALEGKSLFEFPEDERLRWTIGRDTKRIEDRAYCLLGIFGITMSLRYGEGENAFQRLKTKIGKPARREAQDLAEQERQLAKLPRVDGATFNSRRLEHESRCVPSTRMELLSRLEEWSRGSEKSIFWLSGMAGTGKSTIARTIAQKFWDQRCLGASFFFSRGGGDLGNVGKFVSTLAIQLAQASPNFKRFISDAISQNSDVIQQGLRSQWTELILKPLSKVDAYLGHFILVIDALDECEPENDISLLLQLFLEAKRLTAARLQVFLTSRPESAIRLGFHRMPDIEYQSIDLHDIPRDIVDHDIRIFLKSKLKDIYENTNTASSWPDDETIQMLVEMSGGLFIYAATICRFIGDPDEDPEMQLSMILEMPVGAQASMEGMEELDKMYLQVLRRSVVAEYKVGKKDRLSERFRRIVGSIVILFDVLSTSALEGLLSTRPREISLALKALHSLLNVPTDPYSPVRLLHPSFRDFLLDPERCDDNNFWINQNATHADLASKSLIRLHKSLRENMCELKFPGVLINDIQTDVVESCFSKDIQYACRYWVNHLEQTDTANRKIVGLYDDGPVHVFLKEHFLHWLEALGLIRRISEGVLMITRLRHLVNVSDLVSESYQINDY